MHYLAYTVGELVDSLAIMGIANRSQKMDFKHTAEVLMWTVLAASEDNYDNSRLKAILSPYMNQDVEGVPKPFNNVVRLQCMIQHLRNFIQLNQRNYLKSCTCWKLPEIWSARAPVIHYPLPLRRWTLPTSATTQ